MTVVIEYVLLNNFCINYIILISTQNLVKQKTKRALVIISATFGAICSVLYPIIPNFYIQILFKLITGNVMCLIALKIQNLSNYLKNFGVFIFVTALMGGMSYGLLMICGLPSGLKQNELSNFPLFLVYLGMAVYTLFCYALLKLISKNRNVAMLRKRTLIRMNDRIVDDYGFWDSGNMLVDPETQSPVIIIGYKTFSKLFKNITLDKVLLKKINDIDIKGSHYISIETISKSYKILVFPVSEIAVEGKRLDNFIIGLALAKLNNSFGCDILLNSNMEV